MKAQDKWRAVNYSSEVQFKEVGDFIVWKQNEYNDEFLFNLYTRPDDRKDQVFIISFSRSEALEMRDNLNSLLNPKK